MIKSLTNKFKKLPTVAQVAIVGVSLYVAWRVYTKTKARLEADKKGLTEKSELKILEESGIKPSFNDATFTHWADKIEVACTGIGTDTHTIEAIFNKLKNTADFIKLDGTFGVRTTKGFWNLGATAGNMRDWLKAENAMKDRIPKINAALKAKGITKTI